ncbi:hypothetical protein PTKIN_Ptkin07bG0053400 [Pterospermum kingtungense]
MSEEHDQISALPDEVLHHILSFLPSKLCIQTSILSKRWIHHWKFCPVIDIPTTEPHKQVDESESTFISNTLSHHQALKLHKFSIEASIDPFWDPDIVGCIEFPISRQVQILSVAAILRIALPEEHYVLPGVFYSHENVQSLEQISIRGFLFNPNQPSFVTFASLKTLCIFYCVIDNATLKELLSSCPVLESLAIDSCSLVLSFRTSMCQSRQLKHLEYRSTDYGILNLEVDVPSLSSLKFFGDLMTISWSTALPYLVEASLFQLAYTQDQVDFEYIRILVGNISHVKQLGVNSWFPKFVAREHKENSYGWTGFPNLKGFSWFGPLEKECDLIALLAFLGSFSSLEKIELDFRYLFWEGFGDHIRTYTVERSFIELNNGEGEMEVELLHNLKIVMVHHFFGYKSETEFIKRLLQKAVALETLSLTYEMLKFDPEVSDEDVSRRKELVLPCQYPVSLNISEFEIMVESVNSSAYAKVKLKF